MDSVFGYAAELLPVLLAVGIVIVAYGVLKVAWQLKAQNPDSPGFGLDDVAWTAVNAVEQLFFDQDGSFKYQKATDFVLRIFPDKQEEEIRYWIEAAVKQMNDSKPT